MSKKQKILEESSMTTATITEMTEVSVKLSEEIIEQMAFIIQVQKQFANEDYSIEDIVRVGLDDLYDETVGLQEFTLEHGLSEQEIQDSLAVASQLNKTDLSVTDTYQFEEIALLATPNFKIEVQKYTEELALFALRKDFDAQQGEVLQQFTIKIADVPEALKFYQAVTLKWTDGNY